MEHYELKRDDPVEALVAAAERGDEAVITRNGDVVAVLRLDRLTERAPSAPVDIAELEALHARFPAMRVHSATALIREIRDMDDH